MDTYVNDNVGNKSVIPDMGTPVAGSGKRVQGVDSEIAVTGGKTYRFTSKKVGGYMFSLSDLGVDPTQVEWACPIYRSIIIKIPENVTVLYCLADAENAEGYIQEISFS